MSKINSLFFKSQAGNNYYFSPNKGCISIAHPILAQLHQLRSKGVNFQSWSDSIKRTIKLNEGRYVSRKEINYYIEKYQFLIENGFFSDVDIGTRTSGRLNKFQIEAAILNAENIAFEVTEKCNLKCVYCAYGELYTHHQSRASRSMKLETATTLLRYLYSTWEDISGLSQKKTYHIGFYGGEPLINFKLIKKIVKFAEQHQEKSGFEVTFGITTNGLLLERYKEFLVEHNFYLLISLDGDESSNSYRITPEGHPSYQIVYNNIRNLAKQYPEYFKTNVRFNAVLHQRNSLSGLRNYFQEEFCKIPNSSEIGPFWINQEKTDSFSKIYKNAIQELKETEDYELLETDMGSKLPNLREIKKFMHYYNPQHYKSYSDLNNKESTSKICPTGSCIPFSKKIFVTVDGIIRPCEQIGDQMALGKIEECSVNLDFENVAGLLNDLFDQMTQCHNCYVTGKCSQCIFYLIKENGVGDCPFFLNRERFKIYLSDRLSVLEKKPVYFLNYVKEKIDE